MKTSRIALLALGIALATGCVSAGAAGTARATSAERRQPNVITADELATVPEGDLYSAIQRLRPNFLMSRGITSINNEQGIQVFLDNNSRLGGVSSLREIQVSDVKEVRYYSATEATQRFGTGTPNGAILVIRK